MWSLYQNDQFLKPLVFSNSKSQEDIVKETLELIKQDHKVIFIHGICGTGKSAIALNLANRVGKTSIVVPIKNLQEQYKKDYEKDKYLLKANKQKLKINVMTGRSNHECKFLQDNKSALPKVETNSNLHDIFKGKREELKNLIQKDISADNKNLPCKIEIKEKNWNKIKQYLKQNKDINIKTFSTLKDVKRVSVAGTCPYWCPVMPSKYELGGKSFINSIKKKYTGLKDTEFTHYQRRPGCKFYEQFKYYTDSDVIVFNSEKYKLESLLFRKPQTEVEIIDECDEFLDNFSNQKNLNIDRLLNSLIRTIALDDSMEATIKELMELIKQIKQNKRIKNSVFTQEIIPLRETGIYDMIRTALNNYEFFYEIDEESYIHKLNETARMFEDFIGETFIIFSEKEGNLIAGLVTTNLEKRFKQMRDQNKNIVLMSGTLHSTEVLKNIFGLEEFKIIEAETQKQGQIEVMKTGEEVDCNYRNFKNQTVTRKQYLQALSKSVEQAPKPALVHIHAFMDLPSKIELKEFKIKNLISREELKEIQKKDKTGNLIQKFKDKEIAVLFSTRASRGMDFPGNQCNSIIFTKYPYPNVKDAFWRILNKTNPQHYWAFYKDKSERELLQKVYRGLRSKDDHVFVLSPDLRVVNYFEKS